MCGNAFFVPACPKIQKDIFPFYTVPVDGSVYTGSFVRGKEEGKGVLIEKDGTRFEGFFKQGKKDGPFVEMDANGNIVRKGTFRYGRLLEEKK